MMETYRKLRWINDGPRSETTRLPLNFPASKPSEQHFMQAMHQPVVPMLRWTMASRCLQWLCLRGGQSHVWFAPGSWLLQLLLFSYISSTWQIWRYSLTAGWCTTQRTAYALLHSFAQIWDLDLLIENHSLLRPVLPWQRRRVAAV